MSRRRRDEAPITLFSFQDIISCLVGVMVMVALLLAMDGLKAEDRREKSRRNAAPTAATAAEVHEQSERVREEINALSKELKARQAGASITAEEVRVIESRVQQSAAEVDKFRLRLDDLAKQIAAQDATLAERATQAEAVKEEIAKAQIKARRARVQFRPGALESLAPLFVEVGSTDTRIGMLDPQRVPFLEQTLAGQATDDQIFAALGSRTPSTHYAVLVVHGDSIRRFETLRDALYRRGFEVGWQLWDAKTGAFLERMPSAAGVTQ